MALNLEQEELAFLMDLDSTQISKWEQGERLPGIYNAIGLAAATGRLVEDVFFDFRKEWLERFRERRKLLDSIREQKETKTYSPRLTDKSSKNKNLSIQPIDKN